MRQIRLVGRSSASLRRSSMTAEPALPGMRGRIARGCSRRALSRCLMGAAFAATPAIPRGDRPRASRPAIDRRPESPTGRRRRRSRAARQAGARGPRRVQAGGPGAGADPRRGVRAVRGRGGRGRAGPGQGAGAGRQADALPGRGPVLRARRGAWSSATTSSSTSWAPAAWGSSSRPGIAGSAGSSR